MIAPSLLSCDFLNIENELSWLNKSADWLHLDVMDGVFVPNISFGLPIIKAIARKTNLPLDVHLMIIEPEKHIENFADAGANIISVHIEVCKHLHKTVQQIKNAGCKAGVVLNPATPVYLLEDIIVDCDLVLLMSVNPGFGGQLFIENIYTKIEQLKILINRKNPSCFVQIDGGINLENSKLLVEKGANILVAGNSIFNSDNPTEVIKKLKELYL